MFKFLMKIKVYWTDWLYIDGYLNSGLEWIGKKLFLEKIVFGENSFGRKSSQVELYLSQVRTQSSQALLEDYGAQEDRPSMGLKLNWLESKSIFTFRKRKIKKNGAPIRLVFLQEKIFVRRKMAAELQLVLEKHSDLGDLPLDSLRLCGMFKSQKVILKIYWWFLDWKNSRLNF